MRRTIFILFFLIILTIGGIFLLYNLLSEKQISVSRGNPIIIGLSMGVNGEERWSRDSKFFIKRVQELGAEVALVSSGSDVQKQIRQIENLIDQDVSVIVIVPFDSESLKSVIELANKRKVKIVAYDRLIKNSNIDFYISFDNFKVGKLQAESILNEVNKGNFAYIGGSPLDNNSFLLREGSMDVLKPAIERGDINLVIDIFIEDWKPEIAYKIIREHLENNVKIDAIIAANDGLASGIIQALKEKNMDGDIPVSGQDAELSAIRRIFLGTQTSTVYKPLESLAYISADVAVALANGQTISNNFYFENGKKSVPTILLDPVIVNRDNIDSVIINEGFHSFESIYGFSRE